ncbi:MAG: tetratricopeptide repeat protein [Verrucomicrobiota bacterium]|jgi:tetratricopeptide (TPR) repeat protein
MVRGLKSDDPAIYLSLGFAQGRMGNLAAAQACFQKALSLDPANAEARKGLGRRPPIARGDQRAGYASAHLKKEVDLYKKS